MNNNPEIFPPLCFLYVEELSSIKAYLIVYACRKLLITRIKEKTYSAVCEQQASVEVKNQGFDITEGGHCHGAG